MSTLERVEQPPKEDSLFDACRKCDEPRIAAYLAPENKGCVKECDSAQMTMLHHAAFGGSAAIVGALAEHDEINIDAVDLLGWTPLLYAASRGHATAAQLILDGGANTSAKDEMKRTSLHLAVTSTSASDEAKKETIKALLAGGVNPRLKNVAGMTARQTAVANNAGDDIIALFFPAEAAPAPAAPAAAASA